jgi:hypothetical protein
LTEEEWLAHDDPMAMVKFAANWTDQRKRRLFLCACCGRLLESAARATFVGRCRDWGLRTLGGALRVVERFADGFGGAKELELARRTAENAEYVPASIDYGGETGLGHEAVVVRGAAEQYLTSEDVIGAARNTQAATRRPGTPDEGRRELADRLRDVIGNPFRPVEADAAWLAWGDGAVPKIAETIYASGSFTDMPFLADALEDAGCADAAILDHCRGPGPHVRGCWALDLFVDPARRLALAAAAAEAEASRTPASVEPSPVPPRPVLRPGDWLCPACRTHNFARRDVCLKCQTARPAPRLREGDWICPACQAHNFARRQSCHQCKAGRPS